VVLSIKERYICKESKVKKIHVVLLTLMNKK